MNLRLNLILFYFYIYLCYDSAPTRMPSFGMTLKYSQGDLPKDRNSGVNLETTLDGWDGIALEYTVDWPLQLFFTQEVLSK